VKGLTKKQREVVNFIQEFISSQNYSPSYREIMAHFGFRSLGSVYKHVSVLKRKGALAAEKNSARSIALTRPDQQLPLGRMVELPFLGYVAAGIPIETIPQAGTMSIPASLVVDLNKSYILQVRGDSLTDDQILDGDLIIVEARSSATHGETIVALINRNETIVKRFCTDGPFVRLEGSNNPTIQPIVVRQEDVRIQGVVRGLLRRY
jgi:repressor LexA